jgi:CDP-glucose 4,6-dehydratase
MYARTFALPVVITRCGNLFGGGDLNFSRTVPGAIRATLAGERFVIRSDGKFVRDFLYVKDAIQGYLCLAERLAADRSLAGEAFNFSLEIRITVLDLVHKILAATGRSGLEPIIKNAASSEIREQYLDAGKARLALKWSPVYGLDRGLAESLEWYRDFFAAESQQPAQAMSAP